MNILTVNNQALHWREDGDPAGAPVVFANSLGTDLRLWDAVVPLLPEGLRIIRFDKRGHGLSACPPPPYAMDELIGDTEGLLDALGMRNVVFVGLSIGGMIAQGLAARRPDLVRALVLSNTASRMGTPEMWQDRIGTIERDGIAAIAEPILDRWFGPDFRNTPDVALWHAMLTRTPRDGYLGCCVAIAGADLTASTGALRLPTLAIAGSEDGSSPPAQVQATAALIPGSAFHILDGCGHLPCVEAPRAYADILTPFLKEHAHA